MHFPVFHFAAGYSDASAAVALRCCVMVSHLITLPPGFGLALGQEVRVVVSVVTSGNPWKSRRLFLSRRTSRFTSSLFTLSEKEKKQIKKVLSQTSDVGCDVFLFPFKHFNFIRYSCHCVFSLLHFTIHPFHEVVIPSPRGG